MRGRIVSLYMPSSDKNAVTVCVDIGPGQSVEFTDYTLETASKLHIGDDVELVIAVVETRS